MQSFHSKHLLAFYEQPRKILKTLGLLSLALVFLYFFLGQMTFLLWLLAAAVAIALVQALRKISDRGPCVIINEEGINDKRLGLGVIRWSDIESVRMHGVGGAYFISLELFDDQTYLQRQPGYIRLANKAWRFYNVSPLHIKVAYMDVAPDELFEIIMRGVESHRLRS
jgi:hypothetical protein